MSIAPRRALNRWVMATLAISFTGGFFACLAALMFMPVPGENRELVSMMLGNLVGFVAGIVTYHFGSSQESADKNVTIGTLADTAKSAQAALAPLADQPLVATPAIDAAPNSERQEGVV